MKKIKFVLAFLIILVSAKGLFPIESVIVPKIGVGFSLITGIQNDRSKFSATGGIGYKMRFDDLYNVEADILYQIKGGFGKKLNFSTSYISIPVTGRVHIIEHVSFLLGPQISFLLDAQGNGINLNPYTKPLDFSIVFGMTYYFIMGDDRLIFEFIIDVGLVDTSKPNHPLASGNTKNRAGYVMIGWEFTL